MKKTLVYIFLIIIITIIPLTTNKIIIKKVDLNNVTLSKNMVGILLVDNTNYKKKIMQYSDNSFFLNHDEELNTSILGSIFLDYRNNLEDKKIILYGHNSKTIKDAPFHYLENFLNYEYSKKYNIITIKTPKNSFKYKLFSVIIIGKNSEHINLNFDDDTYLKHLKWFKSKSIYNYNVNLDSTSEILILQTCFYKPKNSYLLLAYKKET